MNTSNWNDLVRSVLQKNSLQDCSVADLQEIADKYPYFNIGHLLLSLKLNDLGATGNSNQLQKLSLYIQDPVWMEQLLSQQGDLILHSMDIKSEEKNTIEEVRPEPTPPVEPAPAEAIMAEPAEVKEITEVKATNTNISANELTFEPYHTVDYFASQGIRMKDEDQPRDKFGQQLKSFTEWLKTMKRLPVAEITVNVDSRSEHKVEQMAEHSIAEREVVTEAMAEVWEKQGNTEKAIATYRKLSLLNPSKSSYFAAKIEQLKTI
jgi:hypothetical protein